MHALSPEQVLRIQQLLAERDAIGRRRWSQAEIAAQFDVAESTVNRIARRLGAYRNIKPLPEAAAVEASAERLRELLAQPPDAQS